MSVAALFVASILLLLLFCLVSLFSLHRLESGRQPASTRPATLNHIVTFAPSPNPRHTAFCHSQLHHNIATSYRPRFAPRPSTAFTASSASPPPLTSNSSRGHLDYNHCSSNDLQLAPSRLLLQPIVRDSFPALSFSWPAIFPVLPPISDKVYHTTNSVQLVAHRPHAHIGRIISHLIPCV